MQIDIWFINLKTLQTHTHTCLYPMHEHSWDPAAISESPLNPSKALEREEVSKFLENGIKIFFHAKKV